MMRLSYLFLLSLFLCTAAKAASFDCNKSATKVEKLVCHNAALSKLDEDLHEIYQIILSNPGSHDKNTVIAEQREWLISIRNRCADASCLTDAYAERIKDIEALYATASDDVTCEKMRKFPAMVFLAGLDLGSGSRSPRKFDYTCPESLSNLPELQHLIALGEGIRAENGPTECTGTIVNALIRYYQYSLAGAGFLPSDLKAGDRDGGVLRYFEQWSWESPSNADAYKNFFIEYNKALQALAAHYRQHFGYPEQEARQKARLALMIVVNRAAGAFPIQSLNEKEPLIELLRNDKTSLQDVASELAKPPHDLNAKIRAYSALKVALSMNKPAPWISAFLGAIGPIDDKAFNKSGESALFAALHNRDDVNLLLDSGASVDYTNEFGKTALFYAIGYGDRELVKLLLSHGADINHAYFSAHEINPNNDDCSLTISLTHTKRTPLMHAAQNSDVEMIKLLINNGARLHDLDEPGFSVLNYAVMGKQPENQAYLAALGATLARPIYPADAKNNPLPISPAIATGSVSTDGYPSQLLISPNRSDILVASITSWGSEVAGEQYGVSVYSISSPQQPRMIGHFATTRPNMIRLSPDGKTVYASVPQFEGAPPGTRFGVFIIDITRPDAPQLKDFIPGDFMTMQLSNDGQYLLLQEHGLYDKRPRELMVFSTDKSKATLLCANPFSDTDSGKPLFAYTLATFPDSSRLALYDQMHDIYWYDIASPCKPKLVSKGPDKQIGTDIIGIKNAIIVTGSGGLASYKMDNLSKKVFWWQGKYSVFANNNSLGLLAAIFDGELALLKLAPDGSFTPLSRFVIAKKPEAVVSSIAFADSGWAYLGANGKLSAMKIFAPR